MRANSGSGVEPPRSGSVWRILWKLGLMAALAAGLYLLCDVVMHWASALTPEQAAMKRAMFAALLLAYALLIAAPFVPAVEIGLGVIAVVGSVAAPFVYAATVGGLLLAFALGRWLPYPVISRFLADLRLVRAAAALERSRALSMEDRLAALRARLPARLGRLALGSRYVLLALLINLPGSTLIGGGGGICMMAGVSRLFRPAPAALTIALAVAPLPLGLWLLWPGLLPS